MLTEWRMRPSTADSAKAALEMLSAACDRGDPFRLVLTDALMPDVDGFMLAAAIRADSRFSDVRLIMLTSASTPHGESRAVGAGVAAYLTKPAKHSELLDAIGG